MENNKIKSFIVCISSGMFYFFQNIQSNMFNSLSPELIKEFSISAKAVSVLSTSYFYSNVLFLFAAGVIVNYFPRKKILLIFCGINILSVLFFSLAEAPWQVFICHFISGLSGTFSLITSIRISSNWVNKRYLTTAIGIIIMVGILGSITAQIPFVLLIEAFGWRNVLQLTSAVGVLCFIIILFLVQEYPSPSKKPKFPEFKLKHFQSMLKKTLTNYYNWLLGICGGIVNIPVFVLAAFWGNFFLVQVYGLNKTVAALICSMIAIGNACASLGLAAISDYLGKRKIFIYSAIVLAAFLMTVLFYLNISSNVVFLSFIFFFLGVTSGIQAIFFTVTAGLNEKKVISSAQGLMMTLAMAGGFLQNVFSWLLELKWKHVIENGTPIFSLKDYQRAALILLISYAIAFLILYFSKKIK